MENINEIVPPHLNAEIYRTDTTGTNTQHYWDYVRIHPDGHILIGCSELTGRYWDGSAIISKLEPGVKIDSSIPKPIPLTSGTPDGCFVARSNKVLLCEDSGALSVWTHNDDVWKLWVEEISVAEHDDGALAIDCLEPGKEYVSAGGDGNIKVWDVSEMVCVRNYGGAHSQAINGVAVKPNSSTSFATVSADQYVSLWDDNTSKSVCDLLKNDCGLRCGQWIDENRLIFGDEAGTLRLVDIRNPEAALNLTEFPAPVHRLAVQSELKRVAVCCDNKVVTVCDISDDTDFKVIYENGNLHTNYVRGLAWDPSNEQMLHSVGWDGVLNTHNILSNEDLKSVAAGMHRINEVTNLALKSNNALVTDFEQINMSVLIRLRLSWAVA